MPKKKILHLITGLEIGGAETALLKTLPLLQSDFENRVCCIKGYGPMGNKLEEAGIQVTYLYFDSIFDIPFLPLRFKKIINQFSPDILVTYLIHADLFGRIFGRFFGIQKIICSQRGSLLQWEFLRYADRLTKKLVTQYVVQTKTAQNMLSAKLHLSREKFTIIPNGIDTNHFDTTITSIPLKHSLGIKPDEKVVICVANLYSNKGHFYLLEAFEEVFKHHPKTHLVLAGEGPERENITSQIACYASKNNIHLLGQRTDIPSLLKLSHVFVLPTFYEGMSNAIQEAMASSLAIITTDIPENKDFLTHDRNAILVQVKNSLSIKKALLKLLGDPEFLNKLGKTSQSTVKDLFSIQETSLKWKNLLNKNLW